MQYAFFSERGRPALRWLFSVTISDIEFWFCESMCFFAVAFFTPTSVAHAAHREERRRCSSRHSETKRAVYSQTPQSVEDNCFQTQRSQRNHQSRSAKIDHRGAQGGVKFRYVLSRRNRCDRCAIRSKLSSIQHLEVY